MRSAECKFTRLHFLLYLLYLDDAGSANNPLEDYFVLGGVCVFESQADWFTRELDLLAARFDPEDPYRVEFHASAIYARREAPWKGFKDPEDARNVMRSVLSLARDSCASSCCFACAIQKSTLQPGQDCVALAFEDPCRRFDLFLERKNKQGERQNGLIILDRSTQETSLQRLSRDFRTVGTQWGQVRNLVDTPMFVDSRASRLVQLADHVAYAVFRRFNARDTQYFDIIQSRFDEADGVVHGLEHRHSCKHQCSCPACLSRRLVRAVYAPPAAIICRNSPGNLD